MEDQLRARREACIDAAKLKARNLCDGCLTRTIAAFICLGLAFSRRFPRAARCLMPCWRCISGTPKIKPYNRSAEGRYTGVGKSAAPTAALWGLRAKDSAPKVPLQELGAGDLLLSCTTTTGRSSTDRWDRVAMVTQQYGERDPMAPLPPNVGAPEARYRGEGEAAQRRRMKRCAYEHHFVPAVDWDLACHGQLQLLEVNATGRVWAYPLGQYLREVVPKECAYMCVRQIQWGPDDEEEAMLIRDTARRNLEKFVKENWGRSADSLLPVTDTTVYASPVHRLGVACTELMLEAYARSGLLPERRDLTLGRNGANVGMFRGKIDGCFADYHASLGEAGGAAGTAGVQQQGSERQWEVKLGEEVLVRWPGQDAEEAFKVTNASKAAAEVEMLAMRFEGLLSFDEIQDLRLIFDAMDIDGSGDIDMSEFEEAMSKLSSKKKPKASAEETKAAFDEVDTDGSGEIDFAEFLALFASLKKDEGGAGGVNLNLFARTVRDFATWEGFKAGAANVRDTGVRAAGAIKEELRRLFKGGAWDEEALQEEGCSGKVTPVGTREEGEGKEEGTGEEARAIGACKTGNIIQ